MAVAKRSIFRGRVLQHYAESKQKEVLPRLVSPPVFVFFWILLILLLVAGITAWLTRVPIYDVASGVVLDRGIMQGQQASNEAVAIVFLPASHSLHVQAGQTIVLQLGSAGTRLSYRVDHVEPGTIGPADARQRYRLDCATSHVIKGPSMVLTVSLGPGFPARQYAGSIVSAQLQVGSQRVLSLLPGPGQLIGR
jgi:hypothetical protein